MEMPWDYEEVSRHVSNNESLYTLALETQSGSDFYDLLCDYGMLEFGDAKLTWCNARYAWEVVNEIR
tara:strand:+ start:187 stop:387 length:201 start_codon:yes stop_codon:yes gene_type:complete